MNSNLEHQHLDDYLSGKLSPEAKALFEAAIQQNAVLSEAVQLRRLEFDVAEAIIAEDIRKQMAALYEEDSKSGEEPTPKPSSFRRWWVFFALLCLVVLLVWFSRKPASFNDSTIQSPESRDTASNDSTTQHISDSTHKIFNQPNPSTGKQEGQLLAMRLYQRPDMGLLRGSSAVGDSLAEAVNAWERNDYAKVSASCKKIPIGSAYYWRAQYMYAHAAFNGRRLREATTCFLHISDSKIMPWAEESEWYGLLSLLAIEQQNTPAFEQLWQKINSDTGHPYHESLKHIKR
jgi:hypothetical protein